MSLHHFFSCRMSESSGYGSNSSGSTLTPLGSNPGPTTSPPHSAAMGPSPNNGYHINGASSNNSNSTNPGNATGNGTSNSSQHHLRQQHPAHVSSKTFGRVGRELFTDPIKINHPRYSIHTTYELNKFLTAHRSCKIKYLW